MILLVRSQAHFGEGEGEGVQALSNVATDGSATLRMG